MAILREFGERSTPSAAPEFRAYVAAEAAGIARVLESGVDALMRDPMDRDAVRAVLRRQRALLAAARLGEIRPIAQTLRAVQDIACLVTKLDAPVKVEWLDAFRCARDVMRSAAQALQSGADPRPSPALSRLRTLHDELTERYAAIDPPGPRGARDGGMAAVAVLASPAGTTYERPDVANSRRAMPPHEDAAQCVEARERAAAALRRALELRPRLEQALRPGPQSRALLDEIFDLIRLGLV